MNDPVLNRGRDRRRLEQHAATARRVRLEGRLTQAELAALLGVDRSAISRWESGRRMPRAAVLARYSALLEQLANASLSEAR